MQGYEKSFVPKIWVLSGLESLQCGSYVNTVKLFELTVTVIYSKKREIKFVPVYATRPNSCILSISAGRDAGQYIKV